MSRFVTAPRSQTVSVTSSGGSGRGGGTITYPTKDDDGDWNPFPRSNGGNLFRMLRSDIIEIESFTQDPAEHREETPRPEVGKRWGKPADFVALDPADNFDDVRLGRGVDARGAAKFFYENHIDSASEVHRDFSVGPVIVTKEEVEYNPSDWSSWQAYAKERDRVENLTVDMENTDRWVTTSSLGYQTQRENVTIFYGMGTDNQLTFVGQPSRGERGQKPE